MPCLIDLTAQRTLFFGRKPTGTAAIVGRIDAVVVQRTVTAGIRHGYIPAAASVATLALLLRSLADALDFTALVAKGVQSAPITRKAAGLRGSDSGAECEHEEEAWSSNTHCTSGILRNTDFESAMLFDDHDRPDFSVSRVVRRGNLFKVKFVTHCNACHHACRQAVF